MPKEYVITIAVGEGRLKDIADAVRDAVKEGEGNMSKMEARHEVLQAIVYGIRTYVRQVVCTVFTGNASIAVTEVAEDNVKDLETFLDSLDPVVRITSKTFTERKFEKKIEKGKLPDWWVDALFNRNKTKPSETAQWVYEKFLKKDA